MLHFQQKIKHYLYIVDGQHS